MDEIVHITSLIRKTFEKEPWHGPSVKKVLSNITAQEALQKLHNTHSIIELVSHMTAWRVYTVRKLLGDSSYSVTEDLNFPSPTDWPETLQSLEESSFSSAWPCSMLDK